MRWLTRSGCETSHNFIHLVCPCGVKVAERFHIVIDVHPHGTNTFLLHMPAGVRNREALAAVKDIGVISVYWLETANG
jgi:hypothetical protein